jgi:hypothetical protein
MQDFKDVFLQAEQQAFQFLKAEHGFKMIDQKIEEAKGTMTVFGAVTYGKSSFLEFGKGRFVTLSTAPLRLELDLDIGVGQERYSIYELHSLESDGQFPERTHDLYQAMHDAEQLLSEFRRLASILQACGERFFANDRTLWTDLKNQRALAAQRHEFIRMNSDAEKAFKDKNWQKVVDILESHHADLNELASARLKYAHKQITEGVKS